MDKAITPNKREFNFFLVMIGNISGKIIKLCYWQWKPRPLLYFALSSLRSREKGFFVIWDNSVNFHSPLYNLRIKANLRVDSCPHVVLPVSMRNSSQTATFYILFQYCYERHIVKKDTLLTWNQERDATVTITFIWISLLRGHVGFI